jgi:hypothetical protein
MPDASVTKVILIELATVALTASVPLAVGLLAIAGPQTAKTPAITSAGRDISTLFKLIFNP